MIIKNINIITPVYRVVDFFYRYKRQVHIMFFLVFYIILAVWGLRRYFITDFTVVLALLLSPYIIKPDLTKRGSRKYLYLSVSFMLLAYTSGVQTFYFFTAGFAVLFVLESFGGYISHLPFFLLGLLSPSFKYFNNLFGFPARLQLSEWAGGVLQFLGYKIEVTGNVFVLNGTEFSVDPACVGLKMMALSFLVGLFIMAYFQQQGGKIFSFLTVTGILLLILGLNLLSNLIRILILAIFTILPENPLHDMVGIGCFLVYSIMPSYFLIRFIAPKIKERYNSVGTSGISILNKLLNVVLLIAVTFVFTTRSRSQTTIPNTPVFLTSGYIRHITNGDIMKLEKPGILIYVKPLQRFYGAEHNPMICWVGSGYTFHRIKKQFIGSNEIFTGTLVKGNDILYSAWWFDNGKYNTVNQADWRWKVAKGENFYLINVNSGDESALINEIKILLKARK